jgi:mRNA interferase MazF
VKRGDLITIADPAGDFSGKPRPALVVQSDDFNIDHASVTVCLLTSHVSGLSLFRVPVEPDPATGLRVRSEVEIDKLQAVWRHRIGYRIGHLPPETMTAVDQALRRWLSL